MTISIYSVFPSLGAFAAAVLGTFVVLRNPRSQAHLTLSAMCLVMVVWLTAYAVAYSITDPQLAFLLARIACTSVTFFSIFLYHFTIEFLKLRDERRWLRPAYLVSGFLIAGFILTDKFLAGTWKYYWGYYSRAGTLHPLYLCVSFTLWVRSILLVYRQYKSTINTATNQERQQLKYLLAGYFLAMLSTVDYIQKYGIEIYPVGFFFALLFAVTVSFAILKHQLLDIRIVLRKSLVYSTLIAIITAAYLVMVLVMEHWFAGFFGYRSLVATAMVAGLIALGFNPLRDRIQTFIDRALFSGTPPELAAQREQLLGEVRKGEQLKAVATLAAGLAHEVKNPLASIKTFTEYLDTHFDDPEFRAKFRKIVGGEVERINLIVQQLLEFAKPMPPKLQPVNIARIVDDTLEFLNNDLIGRQVEVNRHYGPTGQVLADPQQLRQVFLNLFLNSLDAMNGHGQLTIGIRSEGADVQVTVTDNGQGISVKDLPHVFEPFFTTKSAGTGLGLPVVKGIITEHGGQLKLASRAGRGTSIEIRLPIAVQS